MHSSVPAGLHQQKTADAIRHGMDRGLEEMLHVWMLCEPHRPEANGDTPLAISVFGGVSPHVGGLVDGRWSGGGAIAPGRASHPNMTEQAYRSARVAM